jgi:hypothetical protein
MKLRREESVRSLSKEPYHAAEVAPPGEAIRLRLAAPSGGIPARIIRLPK